MFYTECFLMLFHFIKSDNKSTIFLRLRKHKRADIAALKSVDNISGAVFNLVIELSCCLADCE